MRASRPFEARDRISTSELGFQRARRRRWPSIVALLEGDSQSERVQWAAAGTRRIGGANARGGLMDSLPQTRRLEGLSDGAFSIIITLLVLEIHRPNAAPGRLGRSSCWSGRPISPTCSPSSTSA